MENFDGFGAIWKNYYCAAIITIYCYSFVLLGSDSTLLKCDMTCASVWCPVLAEVSLRALIKICTRAAPVGNFCMNESRATTGPHEFGGELRDTCLKNDGLVLWYDITQSLAT